MNEERAVSRVLLLFVGAPAPAELVMPAKKGRISTSTEEIKTQPVLRKLLVYTVSAIFKRK
jgi:hypothetical protein